MSVNTTLDALKAKREQAGEDGFTLIELLVVVVIIGILVAIAIPLYLNYRQGAENKSAESDVRGAISAVEQYYTSNGNAYPATTLGTEGNNVTLGGAATSQQTISVGGNNTVNYVAVEGGTYKVCGRNSSGGHVFLYDSKSGGAVKDLGKKDLTDSCTFAAA